MKGGGGLDQRWRLEIRILASPSDRICIWLHMQYVDILAMTELTQRIPQNRTPRVYELAGSGLRANGVEFGEFPKFLVQSIQLET